MVSYKFERMGSKSPLPDVDEGMGETSETPLEDFHGGTSESMFSNFNMVCCMPVAAAIRVTETWGSFTIFTFKIFWMSNGLSSICMHPIKYSLG